jgi:cytochrome c551/c552
MLAEAPHDGKTAFALNCGACHLPDQQVVGPSVVEISKIYRDDCAGFLKWCKSPGKKREGAVQMPSMAHIPDAQLTLIHDYLVKSSAGLSEKRKQEGDAYAKSPTITRRPNVLRIFMPDAGPAAFAVALDNSLSYCWDAGSCRLRYIWKGEFIDPYPVWKGNGSSLASIRGEIVFREPHSPLSLVSGASEADRQFLGYKLESGLPTFRYRVGDTTFTERISVNDGGIARAFTVIATPTKPVTLDLPAIDGLRWSCPVGRVNDGTVTLSPAEAARFILTLHLP